MIDSSLHIAYARAHASQRAGLLREVARRPVHPRSDLAAGWRRRPRVLRPRQVATPCTAACAQEA